MSKARSELPGEFFLRDIRSLRANADALLLAGSRHEAAHRTVELLQTLLTAEIVCVLRYTSLSVSPLGLKYTSIGAEFQEQANDERRHMALLAERIAELGGVPDFSPCGLVSRRYASDETEDCLAEIVRDNLEAERGVIEHYRGLIRHFSKTDHETCKMLKYILQDEEHHIADMHDLIDTGAGAQKPFLN
ncbi:MAG: ferritin-like domain-containing protein [Acidocella sp.]|nr:ferritin-like domain-containing protein [Acidocella sp.]